MNVSEALSGVAPKTEGGLRQLQKTDPKEMAKAMLADKAERDGKTVMTWNRENAPLVPNDRMVGEVNFNLPYIKILNRYVIQNGKIYLMNGITKKTLEQVKEEDPLNFPTVFTAYETFMKKAVEKDPKLCKDCIALSRIVSLPNDSDMVLEHIVAEHPERVLAASRKSVEDPEAEVPAPVTEPGFKARCGKPLPTKHGKRLHELRCLRCKAA